MSDLPLNGAGHVPNEAAFGYAHGLLTPDELRTVDAHIAACDGCRSLLAERLGAADAAADVRTTLGVDSRGTLAARWLAAAAVVVAAAGAVWLARRGDRPAAAASGAEDARVREALRSGRLPLPPFLMELSPPPETLMGASPAAPPRLSPAGTAVRTGSPVFSWEPAREVRRYRVRIFTLSGETVRESPAVPGNSWTPVHPLPPGTYQWQLEGDREADRITLPEPPAVPPRFRVLDATTAARLESLARSRPQAHLKLAIEYARAGAVDDARRELEAELRANPMRDNVRALLGSLDRR